MDVCSGTIPFASPSGNRSSSGSKQQFADQLISAVAQGDPWRVIHAVTDEGLEVLSVQHSETGNTVLHTAIQNSRVDVVGVITGLLVRSASSSTPQFREILKLKNKQGQTPLEVGGLTSAIKTELLAGLSDLWMFCADHGEFAVSVVQKACGCRVCEVCSDNVEAGTKCGSCLEYLDTAETHRDHGRIMEVRRNINDYDALFDGEGLPVCPNCLELAFPPFDFLCGHVLCRTCTPISGAGKICQQRSDNSGNRCRQPLDPIRINEAASQQFIRLFSSQTQYGDDSTLGGHVRETINCLSASATPTGTTQATGVSANPVKAFVINGIMVESCPHIPDQSDRYAVPHSERIYRQYYPDESPDNRVRNLRISELEYRLEFSLDKVMKKLSKALDNARKQQATERQTFISGSKRYQHHVQENTIRKRKKKTQRCMRAVRVDDVDIHSVSGRFVHSKTPDRSREMHPLESCAISAGLPEKMAVPLMTAPASVQTQQKTKQQAEGQQTTEQRVILQRTDGGKQLARPGDAEQQGASGSSLVSLYCESFSVPDTLPDPNIVVSEDASPLAPVKQGKKQESTEQTEPENPKEKGPDVIFPAGVSAQQEEASGRPSIMQMQRPIVQPVADDKVTVAPSYDFGQLLASCRSRETDSFVRGAMLNTLPTPIEATSGPESTNVWTQQTTPRGATGGQRVTEKSANDTRPLAMSDVTDLSQARGSWRLPSCPDVSCRTADSLPGVSIAWSIGRRSSMEDAHIATHFDIKVGGKDVPIKILGVFDGHGSKKVADHAVRCIIECCKRRLELYNTESLEIARIWNAIKIAFVDLDLSHHQSIPCGSTACVALVIDNVLWIANSGDSRAILVHRNGEDIQLSEDAKPGDATYRRSIEKRGGYVAISRDGSDRVGGVLAVARALGDHHLCGAVSSRPKITRLPLVGFSGCLVLVCDGVTDVFTTSKVGDIARSALRENDPDVNIANRIVEASLDAGTLDNVSAVVALLEDASSFSVTGNL